MESLIALAKPKTGTDDYDFARIITVRELLGISNLRLPDYQRPYKWTVKHVQQLLDDILHFSDRSAYRLGTLVLHHRKPREEGAGTLDLVDGQQRTISIFLIIHALWQEKPEIMERLCKGNGHSRVVPDLTAFKFTSPISKRNIKANYAEITRRVIAFDEKSVGFLLDQCELVRVVLTDLSEAFQLFDSQNARGKDLDPHDLLKAYHLREMRDEPEEVQIKCIEHWEQQDPNELAAFFSHYLHPARQWCRGKMARYFTKDDVGAFKGITVEIAGRVQHVELAWIAHCFVDRYNHHPDRRVDGRQLAFPFQLDGIILNGRRFFEFVSHYQALLREVQDSLLPNDNSLSGSDNTTAARVKMVLKSYPGRFRVGDQYIERLFQCWLLCYRDRFGPMDYERALIQAFIWAYSLRLSNYAVYLETIDNSTRSSGAPVSLFQNLRDSLTTTDFFQMSMPMLHETKATGKLDEIKAIFRDLKYLVDEPAS